MLCYNFLRPHQFSDLIREKILPSEARNEHSVILKIFHLTLALS